MQCHGAFDTADTATDNKSSHRVLADAKEGAAAGAHAVRLALARVIVHHFRLLQVRSRLQKRQILSLMSNLRKCLCRAAGFAPAHVIL